MMIHGGKTMKNDEKERNNNEKWWNKWKTMTNDEKERKQQWKNDEKIEKSNEK